MQGLAKQLKKLSRIETHPAALWSFFGTSILLAALAFLLGGFSELKSLTKVGVPGEGNTTGVVLASALMIVYVCFGISLCVNKMIGKPVSHGIKDYLNTMKDKHNFLAFFLVVLIEEFFARWLCLGVLPDYLNPSPFVFYVLFFGSNIAWTLIHFTNFEDKKDRNLMRVMPRFYAGMIYSLIFLKYGFLASLLTHFIANTLRLSLHKVEDSLLDKDFAMITYSFMVVFVASILTTSFFTNKSPVEMASWTYSVEPLHDWRIIDYLIGSSVVIYGLKMLGLVLCFDCGVVQDNGESIVAPNWWESIIGILMLIGLVSGCYYLVGLFTNDLAYKALILAIVICGCFLSSSGSGVARCFLVTLPATYLSICVVEILGLWSLVYFVGHAILHIPFLLLGRR